MPDRWRVVAASVQGTSHEKAGLPCQDAHRWRELSQGVLIAALADGAGSAPCAEVGSQIAATAALDLLHTALARENAVQEKNCAISLLREALRGARNAIEAEARRRDLPLRDFATTLIVLIATSKYVAAVQIGDGAIVAIYEDGQMEALTRPPEAEYANETTFLTSPEAFDSVQHVERRVRISALAAFTDGLQRLALRLPQGEPHLPFFTPLFRFVAETEDQAVALEQLIVFLKSPRITERADDDLTLLLASL